MSTTAFLTLHDPTDQSFLQFGMWSILLHLGILVLFSTIPLGDDVKKATPVVNVRLIDIPASEPVAEESHGEAPPLMTARRPEVPPEPTIFPPPTMAPVPGTPMTMAQVASPAPLPHKAPQDERRVLQDHRAIDSLKLKNYLKAAQRTPTTSTTVLPPLGMPALPLTMVASIPSITAVPRSSPPAVFPESDQKTVLKATPSGANGISKSKVGWGKTIPPVYPHIARESGWEGTVVVRVTVQADGTPNLVQVRKGSGHQVLDDAAIDAVRNWLFVPAKDGNFPIRSVVEIPINFGLRRQD